MPFAYQEINRCNYSVPINGLLKGGLKGKLPFVILNYICNDH